MDVKAGKEPIMMTGNQNPFAIYWDPASRQLITRNDARFVDRDSWMSYPDLLRNFPKKDKVIKEQMSFSDEGNSNFTDTKVYADRAHENRFSRNGTYMVTERFYKVPGKVYFVESEDERIDIEEADVKGFKEEMIICIMALTIVNLGTPELKRLYGLSLRWLLNHWPVRHRDSLTHREARIK